MFQAHTALTELSFAGTAGVRRSTVMEDAKVVARERLALETTGRSQRRSRIELLIF